MVDHPVVALVACAAPQRAICATPTPASWHWSTLQQRLWNVDVEGLEKHGQFPVEVDAYLGDLWDLEAGELRAGLVNGEPRAAAWSSQITARSGA